MVQPPGNCGNCGLIGNLRRPEFADSILELVVTLLSSQTKGISTKSPSRLIAPILQRDECRPLCTRRPRPGGCSPFSRFNITHVTTRTFSGCEKWGGEQCKNCHAALPVSPWSHSAWGRPARRIR